MRLTDISRKLARRVFLPLMVARRAVEFVLSNPTRASLLIQTALLLLRQRRFAELKDGFVHVINDNRLLDSHFHARAQFEPPLPIDPYDAWLEVNKWNDRCLAHLLERLGACKGDLPKISVIVPIYNTPIEFLLQMLASVKNQVYQDWELCLVDDCSTESRLREVLAEWARDDSRVRLLCRKSNGGIVETSNDAARLATGDFLAFMDHDDELAPDALAEVALYIAERPETDIVYSDEDKIDVHGCRYGPQFKPDWSPELLLSYNYLNHLVAVRRTLFNDLGGLRKEVELCQDFDFVLRATERARHVGHVPLILYHWRAVPGSGAVRGDAKPTSFSACRLGLDDALSRRGHRADIFQPEWAVKTGNALFGHEFPDDGPSTTILIFCKNDVKSLRGCLTSLQKTTYRNYEIVVMYNGSDDPEKLNHVERHSCRILPGDSTHSPPSIAHAYNSAVEQVASDYVLLLERSAKVLEPKWLSRMMGYAMIQGVGAVGALLICENGTVQHAGVVQGVADGLPAPSMQGLKESEPGYMVLAKAPRNCSAVAGTCMLTPRALFMEIGGLEAHSFPTGYFDIDYCLRLSAKGFRTVYCPGAKLSYEANQHPERTTDDPGECAKFRSKYPALTDPYYSPHCSPGPPPVFKPKPRKLVTAASKAIRTLMFSPTLGLTGGPYCLLELAVALKRKGIIKPIVVSPIDGPLRDSFEEEGIEVRLLRFPIAGADNLLENQDAISEFLDYIKRLDCGVVYGNTLETWYAIETAHSLGLPSVWNVRESDPWQDYFRYLPPALEKRALECLAYPYRVIFVSDASRGVWSPLDTRHNFMVIHDGLDLIEFERKCASWTRGKARESLGLRPDEIAILLLGTVCARKGQHDLPLALARSSEDTYSKIRCFIVGDSLGTYSTALGNIVSSLPQKLRERIEVIAETPEAHRYFRAADIFVCTSRVESYPRVILEAMAHRLPIITTPVFGISEQVRSGFNALLYEPGDIVQLAERLDTMINDHHIRVNMAANSRRVLDALIDFEAMAEAYAEVFREAYFSKGKSLAASGR